MLSRDVILVSLGLVSLLFPFLSAARVPHPELKGQHEEEALTFCKCWSAIAKTWLRSRYRLHHGSSTLKKINSIPEKNKYNLLLSCCSESKFSWRFERSLFFPLLFYVYITSLFCIKAAVFQHS